MNPYSSWPTDTLCPLGPAWAPLLVSSLHQGKRQWHPIPVLLPGESHGRRNLAGCSPWGREELDIQSDFTFNFYFHALEKEMATHSSILAWRIPGTGEPGTLPSMGLHRVRHDWSDLAAAAAAPIKPAGSLSSSWFPGLFLPAPHDATLHSDHFMLLSNHHIYAALDIQLDCKLLQFPWWTAPLSFQGPGTGGWRMFNAQEICFEGNQFHRFVRFYYGPGWEIQQWIRESVLSIYQGKEKKDMSSIKKTQR